MKCLATLLCLSVFTVPAFSQSENSKDSTLEIEGASLVLGMSKAQVFSELSNANLLISEAITNKSWFICSPIANNCNPPLGSFTLKDDQLIMITKRWAGDSGSVSDLLTALYGAVAALEAREMSQCRIKTKQEIEPTKDIRHILLTCSPHIQLDISLIKTPGGPFRNMIEEIVNLKPEE